MNTYHDQEIQTDRERGNVTIQSHLDDLITFDSLNDLISSEYQRDLFDIFLKEEKINSEEETYISYKEMSLRELDSYYFRSN